MSKLINHFSCFNIQINQELFVDICLNVGLAKSSMIEKLLLMAKNKN